MGRPPIGKVAMTGAERTRLYRLKHGTTKSVPKPSADNAAEIAALRKELAQAKARIAELEKAGAVAADEVARLKDELYTARMESVGARFAPRPRATKPKAEKPPLPPDEVRDRQIKALKTRLRNVTSELHASREWHARKTPGAMPFRTRGALMKCLHPDQRGNATEADKDEACKLFTSWTGDSNKARR
jgi:hypothetical protein